MARLLPVPQRSFRRQWPMAAALALATASTGFAAVGCDSADLEVAGQNCASDEDCPAGQTCAQWTRLCSGADAPDAPDAPDAASCGAVGSACDDGDPCTRDDACTAGGTCAGASFSCDDGFGCTIDVCDGVGGCAYTVQAGRCLIGGACVSSGAARPGDPCQGCLPSVSVHAWSDISALACDDADPCTLDTCDPQTGCAHAPSPDC